MTGKLIKNDLKSGASIMGNIYLSAAIAVAALLFSALFKTGSLVKFLLSLAVVIIAFIAVVVTFVSVVFGANKTLFGREGYLTQTLPVRTSSLIFSKWLSSSIWVIISYAFVAAAAFGVYFYWTSKNNDGAEMYDMIYSFAQSFGIGAEIIYKKYLIISAIIGLFNACIFVMFVLFAITIDNIRPFNKLGTFGIIVYLAITLGAIQGISYGLSQICDVTLLIDSAGKISMAVSSSVIEAAQANGGLAIGFTSVYFKAIITVFIYIFTVQLTETKINLK